MTSSYPYLKIAREFNVNYGDVLWMAHIIENPDVFKYNYYSCAIISAYLRQLHNRTMRLTSLALWNAVIAAVEAERERRALVLAHDARRGIEENADPTASR